MNPSSPTLAIVAVASLLIVWMLSGILIKRAFNLKLFKVDKSTAPTKLDLTGRIGGRIRPPSSHTLGLMEGFGVTSYASHEAMHEILEKHGLPEPAPPPRPVSVYERLMSEDQE